MQTDAITPNNSSKRLVFPCPFNAHFDKLSKNHKTVGPTMLWVVGVRFHVVSNFAQRLPKTCNGVCKRTQHVTSNNVASVCTGLYQISNLVPRVLSVLLVPTRREREGREGEQGCQLADSRNFRKFWLVPLARHILGYEPQNTPTPSNEIIQKLIIESMTFKHSMTVKMVRYFFAFIRTSNLSRYAVHKRPWLKTTLTIWRKVFDFFGK